MESHNTFMELGDGKKVLSWGRAVNVPVVTSGFKMKTNLTVTNLLHGVDLVLGMAWLKVADPFVEWCSIDLGVARSERDWLYSVMTGL